MTSTPAVADTDETPSGSSEKEGSGGPRLRLGASVVICVVAVLVALLASLCLGNRLLNPLDLFGGADQAVMESRLRRTVIALLLGAAFGVAGTCLQGLTRNPLADSGLLGLNAGAICAMVAGYTLIGGLGIGTYVWFGFAGAAIAAVGVHLIASLGGGGATPAKLTIAGAALAAALTSWSTAMLLTFPSALEQIRRWQIGSVAGKTWDSLLSILPFLVVGLVLALSCGRILNALALGDDLARGLGRNTSRDRIVVGIGIVLLIGASVALAGPIVFLGLIVPHLVRRQVGGDYTRILPLAAGWGAVLMLVADTLGRIIGGVSEVQVGVMLAVIGAPVFLVMIRRGRLGNL